MRALRQREVLGAGQIVRMNALGVDVSKQSVPSPLPGQVLFFDLP